MNQPGLVLFGEVKPPPDMIAAAKGELSPEAFDRLMKQTGGTAPTPATYVAFVEKERNAHVA